MQNMISYLLFRSGMVLLVCYQVFARRAHFIQDLIIRTEIFGIHEIFRIDL